MSGNDSGKRVQITNALTVSSCSLPTGAATEVTLSLVKAYLASLDTKLIASVFGELETCLPKTLFDSKQLSDTNPLLWDDAEVSGSGTASVWTKPWTTLSVGALTAGRRIRQTKRRINYQPGKTARSKLTGSLPNSGAGITAYIGRLDDDNGVAWGRKNGVTGVLLRSKVSGSAVDTFTPQSSWNIDRLDGAGASGVTLDLSKVELFCIDYVWHGVGPVRFGVAIGNRVVWVHQYDTANIGTAPYMATPNLPVRYEITNDGTGAAASMRCICVTCESLGGHDPLGIPFGKPSGAVAGLTSANTYAILGIRLRTTHLDTQVILSAISAAVVGTNDQARWSIRWNPTIAGSPVWADHDSANSAVQTFIGSAATIATGGVSLGGEYFTNSSPATGLPENSLQLGSKIDGTPDVLCVCLTPVTASTTGHVSLTWREME